MDALAPDDLSAGIESLLPPEPEQPKGGQPRTSDRAALADKGYDRRRCRRKCWARSITPGIARLGIESSEHLGRYRWIVERTLAWLARLRSLTIRYE